MDHIRDLNYPRPNDYKSSSEQRQIQTQPKQVSKLPILKRSETFIVDQKSLIQNINPHIHINETKNKTIKNQLSKLDQMQHYDVQSSTLTHRINNPKSKSLTLLKQQKKAEINKISNHGMNKLNDGILIQTNSKSLDTILKNSRMTGTLNLSNFDLEDGM